MDSNAGFVKPWTADDVREHPLFLPDRRFYSGKLNHRYRQPITTCCPIESFLTRRVATLQSVSIAIVFPPAVYTNFLAFLIRVFVDKEL